MIASLCGDFDTVKLLLKHGAITDVCGHLGMTSLSLASHNGSEDVVDLLLTYGAFIEMKDEGGLTPLALASRRNRTKAASVLLDHGANVEGRGTEDTNPLQIAASLLHVETAELLINFGADRSKVKIYNLGQLSKYNALEKTWRKEQILEMLRQGRNGGFMEAKIPILSVEAPGIKCRSTVQQK